MNLINYSRKVNEIFYNESMINPQFLTKISSLKENSKEISIELFYFSKPVIKLSVENGMLFGKVEENNYKNLYLSYLTLNNSFNLSPKETLIDIIKLKKYRFYIDIESNEDLEIKPIVVHYHSARKERLTELKQQGELVEFYKNEDKCRLTFKLIGNGEFLIKQISIVPEDDDSND